MLQSVVSNHALVDGNKRLGLAAVIVLYGVNGYRLILDNDGAYDLIISLASGELRDVQQIADRPADSTTATARPSGDQPEPPAGGTLNPDNHERPTG